MSTITLDTAVYLVRQLQPSIMAKGYYLALAGGTINNGHSTNDIDLVAVPRTSDANIEQLKGLIASLSSTIRKTIVDSRERPIDVLCVVINNLRVDIAIIKFNLGESNSIGANMAFPSHIKRIDKLSEKDKLWELYLHTLAGWHGNSLVNDMSQTALVGAKGALKVWNEGT